MSQLPYLYDFESKNSLILLNPYASQTSQVEARASLPTTNEFESHFWISTSGTTAKSHHEQKWVALSKEAILTSAKSVNTFFSSNSNDVWLHALPNYHVGGLGIWARGYLSGAKIVDVKESMPKWSSSIFSELCQKYHPTLTALVPTQIYDLVNERVAPPPSLRAAIVGGGAMSKKLFQSALELGWPLCQSYGLTECSSQVATAQVGDPFGALKILPHVEINTDKEQIIHLKSYALITAYAYLSPDEMRIVDPKTCGWFKTEDIGFVDRDFLSILGRTGRFMKIGGESVNFTHLEIVFQECCLELQIHEDCALISVEDERLGRVIHLKSTLTNSHQTNLLIEHYNKKVMPFEKIRVVEYVESIPRTSLGKLYLNP